MDKASIFRIIAFILSLSTYFGINIPESTVELVSSIVVAIAGLYVAYKNNYLFAKGVDQKAILEEVKLYDKYK